MISSLETGQCAECQGEVVDAGDELVCRRCGIVTEKQVMEERPAKPIQAIDFTPQALGGYLGPLEYGFQEKFSRGLSASSSTFRYLKLVSDHVGRDDSTAYGAVRMIERVCEKLSLPKVVLAEAVVMAKRLLEVKRARNDITTAAVSAFAVITACKIEGVTSVGVREIVQAHRALGRRVKISALIELSLSSPVKAGARRAEEYIERVLARLAMSEALGRQLEAARLNRQVYLGRVREAAREALAAIPDEVRGGHNPCALAATAVYAGESILARRASRRRLLTQRAVADSVDVAEYTIREQYGEIFRQSPSELGLVPTGPLPMTAPPTS